MSMFLKYKLELIVFLTGALCMVLELVGSRVVSPYFGNSLFVWTSLIGVILGALSLGYFWGGKIADKRQDTEFLAGMLFAASTLVLLTALLKEVVLTFILALSKGNMEMGLIVSILVLFGPVSVIFGIISPFAARLKLSAIKTSGAVVGNLYAISTFGSIVGTFSAGFLLIPLLGNTAILYLISGTLLGLSFIAIGGKNAGKFLPAILVLVCVYLLNGYVGIFKIKAVADVDTQYGRILVRDMKGQVGRVVRYLSTDNSGWESAVNLNNPDELLFDYIQAYRLGEFYGPQNKTALMIGGAAYTYPRHFLLNNLESTMDVVEIDPEMTRVAKKYFFLKDDPRMNIFHKDARLFVKEINKKYDLVYLDAFLGITPPSHLTTLEFMKDISNILSKDGVLLINLISAIDGENSGLFTAQANTLTTVFPSLDVYMLRKIPRTATQNLLLVAHKNKVTQPVRPLDASLKVLLSNKFTVAGQLGAGQILTDDHAPTEYLAAKMFR